MAQGRVLDDYPRSTPLCRPKSLNSCIVAYSQKLFRALQLLLCRRKPLGREAGKSDKLLSIPDPPNVKMEVWEGTHALS